MKILALRPLLLLFTSLLLSASLAAQFKPALSGKPRIQKPSTGAVQHRIRPLLPEVPVKTRAFKLPYPAYRTLQPLSLSAAVPANWRVQYSPETGLPIAIYGSSGAEASHQTISEKVFAHLQALAPVLQIEAPEREFRIADIHKAQNGRVHVRLQQYHHEWPIYGGELIVHLKEGMVTLTNGKPYPSTQLGRSVPQVSRQKALSIAWKDAESRLEIAALTSRQLSLTDHTEEQSELVIYYPNEYPSAPVLAWQIDIVPNLYHRERYFVDAVGGVVLRRYGLLCGLHHDKGLPADGPTVTLAPDLSGELRTVNAYRIGDTYVMIDASRPMFDAAQTLDPGDPSGVIWTLDANNDTPIANDSFSVRQILSDDNIWTDPVAVSAHYNAGQAYEYFLNTFGRNSISGRGGTIISIIHVADEDGSAMDNAFWSGSAMFYGDGDNVFAPLALALDVAGHEMSHGVVQTSANLEYLGQSGAINESYADIFGAMIDRDDWQIGEDVVISDRYPTGALRDLSNPNNGGSGLSSPGWQPANMDEFVDLPFTEEGDNGGVHINSGIPNLAYFIFASSVGKDIAERVYYNALINYLTRYSQFVDLRIAIIASSQELYGQAVADEAAAAFTAVGISGETRTDIQDELEVNQGQRFVIFSDEDKQSLNLYQFNGAPLAAPLVSGGVSSKPSATDDGSIIVYVDGDNNIQAILFDWANDEFRTTALTDNGIWRNAAISKDGRLLAALTTDLDDQLIVFRLDTGEGQSYTLVNPTTAEGVTTGNVAYADALEWSYDGGSVMYDALSTITKVDGTIEFWDIGFIEVWDESANDFGSGFISKLFSALPPRTSVGNPTFAKNSPNVIAMDLLNEADFTYSIIGADVASGEVDTIFDNTGGLGFPTYSIADEQLVFDARVSQQQVLAIINLRANKIDGIPGTAQVYLSPNTGAQWGTVFANGERTLTDTGEPLTDDETLRLFPNPSAGDVQLQLNLSDTAPVFVEVFDQTGRRVYQRSLPGVGGKQQISLQLTDQPRGMYLIRISQQDRQWSKRLLKTE